MKRAIVLLSGGLDSATTLAIARGDGFESHALRVADKPLRLLRAESSIHD